MSQVGRTVYCIDTSILIDLHRLYPQGVFPSLWTHLERLVGEGRAVAPNEALKELRKQDDWLTRWAKRQGGMFRSLDGKQLEAARKVVAQFPPLAHAGRATAAADPFLVALALAEKGESLFGSDYVVVSSERRKRGGCRIPNACDHYGIKCLSLLEFIEAEGWTF